MGAVIRIIQCQKLLYQLLRLRRGQTLVALDCSLAGHGSDLIQNHLGVFSANVFQIV